MIDPEVKERVIEKIKALKDQGLNVVLVHGGGPYIKKMLELAKVESVFVNGHRVTSPTALKYIEMTLKGEVNSMLVNLLSKQGIKAVGLSGKDGQTVVAEKRYDFVHENGNITKKDLGQVGNVKAVHPALIDVLLKNGFLPVLACIASDEEGNDYNINADMFAGHIAGHLKADHYLVLTDVDGLLKKVDDPSSLIHKIRLKELIPLIGTVIKGGMLPKVESCQIALQQGAKSARIINGTKPDMISSAIFNNNNLTGTEICIQ